MFNVSSSTWKGGIVKRSLIPATFTLGCVIVGQSLLPCVAHAGSKTTHRWLKAGWKSDGPAIIGHDGKIEQHLKQSDELSDAWHLSDGGVVFSFSQRKTKSAGIVRLDRNFEEMWVYTCSAGRDNHSCQPLPGGCFLAGESSKDGAWMVELDKDGRRVKEVKVELNVTDPHHTFRHVRKTRAGTYLAAIMKGNQTVEWDSEGKVIRTFPNGHYAAVRLPNGNTVTSGKPRTPDMGGITEYDKDGNIVWALTKADFERLGLKIQMICGFHVLPNGNVVFSNVAHGAITKEGKLYKVLEITRDKELVWFVDDPQFDKLNLGSIQILDIDGRPEDFEALK